ncbi:hypothetical protein [uncultured Campylobacter sp.]|uniref:hypothetical protein n=1 Tax=uncultured Campylobacter sp. TaxID=218934 RepID=UPI002604CEBE|nr:hypothetical protein [uncultured Campylobacter sp.]
MTTKEMIEVMQAYEKGEEIERRSANCEEEWTFVNLPLWNWDKFEYRIKPKEKRGPKFKIGDVLVHLEKEGQPLYWGDIYRVVSIDEKYTAEEAGYQYKGAYEYFEKIFIKADDVLWYWEYQDVDGEWEKTNVRYAKRDLNNEVLGSNERETAVPLYALGFRLPRDKDKE